MADDTENDVLALLAESIAANQETYSCLGQVAAFFHDRTAERYEEFLRDPYPILASEFGEELSTINADELRSLITSPD